MLDNTSVVLRRKDLVRRFPDIFPCNKGLCVNVGSPQGRLGSYCLAESRRGSPRTLLCGLLWALSFPLALCGTGRTIIPRKRQFQAEEARMTEQTTKAQSVYRALLSIATMIKGALLRNMISPREPVRHFFLSARFSKSIEHSSRKIYSKDTLSDRLNNEISVSINSTKVVLVPTRPFF